MEKILVNKKLKKEILDNLKSIGIDILNTKENNNLLEPLKGHPDILLHQLSNGDVVVDRENYKYYKELLSEYNVIPSDCKLDGKYPKDISLNAVVFKNLFIHNLNYTDKKLLDFYSSNGYRMINVKQGYTKCNIVVGKNVLITSDVDIYNSIKDFEKILLIDHKQIILEGFNYGFIGGTSGLINDKIYFTGSLKNHSSYEEIIKFLNDNNEEYEFLSEKPIEDYGSLIFLKKDL